jgi:hypothetical protein
MITMCPRSESQLTHMIDIALTMEFAITADGTRRSERLGYQVVHRGGGGRVAAVASCEHAYALMGYVMAGQSGDRRRNGAGQWSRAALDTGRQVEDGGDLTRVVVDVELRVQG